MKGKESEANSKVARTSVLASEVAMAARVIAKETPRLLPPAPSRLGRYNEEVLIYQSR
jgi:hypothetical protein